MIRVRLTRRSAAIAVFAAALAGSAPALRNGFAYDDVPIVLGDARVRAPGDLGAIFGRGYWQEADLALYRPITTLSFAIDWRIAGQSSVWFHATNVLLHAAACVLAFFLLARFFGALSSLAGALIFAVHPVHVESVANVVGRAELLSAVFALLACLVWVSGRPVQAGTKTGSAPHDRADGAANATLVAGASATASVVILYVLALLSKEGAVIVPAVLVLLDAVRGELRRGRLRAYLRARAPAIVALALVVAGYLALRAAVLGTLTPTRVDPILEVARAPAARILTALQAWPEYARLLFFPVTLLADYGPRVLEPAFTLSPAGALGLVLLVGAVLGGAAALARGRGRTALALLWVPVTMLPVSNLLVPIGVLVAERTLYLPSFAVAVVGAGLAERVVTSAAVQSARRLAAVALATVLALLVVRSWTRIPDWESTDTILVALVRDRPDAFRGQWHLARMARAGGHVAAALAGYDTAIALWPHRQRLIIEAAGYAAEQRRTARALELARLAARQWPGDLNVQRLLAGTALDAGDLDTAGRAIREGLALGPRDSVLLRMEAFLDSIRTTRQP